MTDISPAALELLRLLKQRPIPSAICSRAPKKELHRLGFALPEQSHISTMDKGEDGKLVATATRQAVMLCITDSGKRHLAALDKEQENAK